MLWGHAHRSSRGNAFAPPGWWLFVIKGQGPLAAAMALNVLWFVILAWGASLIVGGMR